MPQYEFSVSLRVSHPEMKAEYISEALSMKPTWSRNVGEPRVAPNGRSLGGTYKESLWSLDYTKGNKVGAEDILLEDFIAEKNVTLTEHKEFFGEVHKSGGTVEYFIGWFSNGSVNMNIVLDSKLMNTASDLNISIALCAYPEHE